MNKWMIWGAHNPLFLVQHPYLKWIDGFQVHPEMGVSSVDGNFSRENPLKLGENTHPIASLTIPGFLEPGILR